MKFLHIIHKKSLQISAKTKGMEAEVKPELYDNNIVRMIRD